MLEYFGFGHFGIIQMSQLCLLFYYSILCKACHNLRLDFHLMSSLDLHTNTWYFFHLHSYTLKLHEPRLNYSVPLKHLGPLHQSFTFLISLNLIYHRFEDSCFDFSLPNLSDLGFKSDQPNPSEYYSYDLHSLCIYHPIGFDLRPQISLESFEHPE